MDSQKPPKDVDTCGTCWSTFRVQRATGHIHKHGSRSNPCPGSGKPPSTVQSSQPLFSTQQSVVGAAADDTSSSNTTTPLSAQMLTDGNDALCHPQWKTLVSRIPRAARPGCRELLTRLLRRITSAPMDKSAWRELLQFGGNILAKPKRGGVNRNLSNIINRRVAARDQSLTAANNAPHTVNCRSTRKTSDATTLAAAVTSKLEAGNFNVAVRIICSDDTPAPHSEETLKVLEAKRPGPANDRRPRGPLQVSSDDVRRALRSFPVGSSGGLDGLTPQHILDLLTGATDESLEQAIVGWVNVMLAGSFSAEINEVIFGGRLMVLSKQDGGIRPITVGYTLRRLAAKCANSHVIERRSQEIQPLQLGAGVKGG